MLILRLYREAGKPFERGVGKGKGRVPANGEVQRRVQFADCQKGKADCPVWKENPI